MIRRRSLTQEPDFCSCAPLCGFRVASAGLTWLGKDLEAYPRSLSGRTAMLGFFVFALFINAA